MLSFATMCGTLTNTHRHANEHILLHLEIKETPKLTYDYDEKPKKKFSK